MNAKIDLVTLNYVKKKISTLKKKKKYFGLLTLLFVVITIAILVTEQPNR